MDSIEEFKDVSFDLDSGINSVIQKMSDVLNGVDVKRWNTLQSNYSDVFKNIENSSNDNKDFLLADLSSAIDLSCPEGWRFGQDEEFSVIYRFWSEDPSNDFFDN